MSTVWFGQGAGRTAGFAICMYIHIDMHLYAFVCICMHLYVFVCIMRTILAAAEPCSPKMPEAVRVPSGTSLPNSKF